MARPPSRNSRSERRCGGRQEVARIGDAASQMLKIPLGSGLLTPNGRIPWAGAIGSASRRARAVSFHYRGPCRRYANSASVVFPFTRSLRHRRQGSAGFLAVPCSRLGPSRRTGPEMHQPSGPVCLRDPDGRRARRNDWGQRPAGGTGPFHAAAGSRSGAELNLPPASVTNAH